MPEARSDSGCDESPILRILTLNVWGMRQDWPRRRAVLRSELDHLVPDVLTLQETVVDADVDQAREILGPDAQLVHQRAREPDGQGVTTASRFPVGEVRELDLHVTERTHGFACTSLVVELLAPDPWGRVWVVNHLPDYQLDHALERERQAVVTAAAIEDLLAERPGHVIVAGDLDADPESSSVRFWTGRQSLDGRSVCYRNAWESVGRGARDTFVPDNPYSADWDWPFRSIDQVLVRCGPHGGPTLRIADCRRVLDGPDTTVSDHYGVLVDLVPVEHT